jgi:hypothetical protein
MVCRPPYGNDNDSSIVAFAGKKEAPYLSHSVKGGRMAVE